MEERPFVAERSISSLAQDIFENHQMRIARLLPAADVQHVGGTAVPGALTKGDIDLAVRVPKAAFKDALRTLESAYEIHQPNNWIPTYASFKDDVSEELPVGVQLTVSGSEDDVFVATRDLLRNSSEMLSRYNDIKRAHKNDSETYRASKAVFFKNLLNR